MIWILVGKYFSQDAKLYSRYPSQEFVPLALYWNKVIFYISSQEFRKLFSQLSFTLYACKCSKLVKYFKISLIWSNQYFFKHKQLFFRFYFRCK